MLKVGNYYITAKGRLAKIVSEFNFQDGGVLQCAVHYPGAGWACTRAKPDGTNVTAAEHNIKETDDFKGFLTFCKTMIDFDHTSRTWKGTLYAADGSALLALTGIESQERALKLLQLGAQEKVLTWMQESGYVDDELEEGAE